MSFYVLVYVVIKRLRFAEEEVKFNIHYDTVDKCYVKSSSFISLSLRVVLVVCLAEV